MLLEISKELFYKTFPHQQNPFLKEEFITLNSNKVDRVVYLVQNSNKPAIGLIAGIKNSTLVSHFSAPFGGFLYRHENIYTSEMEKFVDELKKYIININCNLLYLNFAPSIYGISFNSKMIAILLKKQFTTEVLDLTNWVDLNSFAFRFNQRNSREYYNQALRHELEFIKLTTEDSKKQAYDLISANRKRNNRPMYMTFNNLLDTGKLWPIDFFGIFDLEKKILASGIFYQFSDNIVYAAFWGDNERGRPKRAMDFLSFNLWSYYKNMGFSYIDLGISTENGGIINEGLLRFKETHEAQTELKYTLCWHNN
ncbi:MAG TPA: hypothetical protein DCG75_17465 [Bacteroidales bacterium]|nr:hypothetical protein [Bacteroidales bacterium]